MFRVRFLPLTALIILLAAPAVYADVWYRDADGDDYGDDNDWLEAPTQPAGYVATPGDCDDDTNWIYPGAPEYVGDGIDSNCDGMEDCYEDLDSDGYGSSTIVQSFNTTCSDYDVSIYNGDCDDTQPTVYPGAPEIVGDGVDQDCNGYEDCYQDLDFDSYGSTSVAADAVIPDGGNACITFNYSENSIDCDDTRSEVHPGATEIVGNGLDDNCDGTESCFEDLDTDGFGSSVTRPSFDLDCADSGEATNDFDCDDTDSDVYPGAFEIPADGVDQDCDGGELCYLDQDTDGYGTDELVLEFAILDCLGSGVAPINGDCDGGDGYVYPGAPEIPYDGIDQNCDAANDYDYDGDSYVAIGYESEVDASAPNTGDCDDTAPAVHPGAAEVCGDGVDNDCDPGTSDICAALGISSIADVGNDQGGQVRIAWSRSADDAPEATEPVTAYDIYRRIDAFKAAGTDDTAAAEKAWPAGDWDFITQVPAAGEEIYHAVVPTLCDSTDAGVCWSVFFLRARTASPYVFSDCTPDSGYSIDNLAPEAPLNLAAAYAAESVSLQWEESEAADFDYFRVYRSADPDFVPAPELLVRNTTATNWTDPVQGGWDLHYKITAVDFAGNEGLPASVQQASGSDLPAAGGRLALHPNVPNPFNPSTTIEFELPDARRVRLEIFTLDGRRIAVLAEGWRESGLHREVWNGRADDGRSVASGAYLYRLDAGDRVLTRRMLLVK